VRDVLVIGGSGLLGQHLLREAQARGHRATGTGFSGADEGLLTLDLGDVVAGREIVSRARPGLVALAAAMTSVDGCETHPDLAERVNAIAPGEVAEGCRGIGARLVYFSTDYVFDGRGGPSDEEAEPHPLNVYGRTKLEGERNVLRLLPEALVLRTCANFGWNRLQSKENSVTWILNRLRRGEPVPLFTDQWVSPSYVPHVARVAFELVERGTSGVVHVASRGCLTRLEVGEAVCDVFGQPRSLLRPSKLADAKLAAPRPRKSCLGTRRMERFPDIPVPTFRQALEDMRGSE
jgi:dTDP-4-dehydrorhamnose reductase